MSVCISRSGTRSMNSVALPSRSRPSRSARDKAYTRLPSTPCAVTMNSPRCVPVLPSGRAQLATTFFTAAPLQRSRRCALHTRSKPQLAARKGVMCTPRAASVANHVPSLPSAGQLAPPSANTTRSWAMSNSPRGVAKRKAPLSLQPCQR